MKKKIYPSSAAFMRGNLVVTEYNKGCLRYVLAKAAGYDDGTIPEIYQALGEKDEQRYEEYLQNVASISTYQREVPFKMEIGDQGVVMSGRIDFLTTMENGLVIPHEKKGTMSKGTIYGNIRTQTPKLNHLAQLVCYMVHLQTSFGVLAMTGYKVNKNDEFEVTKARATKVEDDVRIKIRILDDGRITANDVLTDFTVMELADWISAAASVLERPYIAQRPDSNGLRWGPCDRCPLKEVCDKHDEENLTVEEFLQEVLK